MRGSSGRRRCVAGTQRGASRLGGRCMRRAAGRRQRRRCPKASPGHTRLGDSSGRRRPHGRSRSSWRGRCRRCTGNRTAASRSSRGSIGKRCRRRAVSNTERLGWTGCCSGTRAAGCSRQAAGIGPWRCTSLRRSRCHSCPRSHLNRTACPRSSPCTGTARSCTSQSYRCRSCPRSHQRRTASRCSWAGTCSGHPDTCSPARRSRSCPRSHLPRTPCLSRMEGSTRWCQSGRWVSRRADRWLTPRPRWRTIGLRARRHRTLRAS